MRRQALIGAVVVGAWLLLAGGRVAAEATDPPNATGPCTASATVRGPGGETIDPYASSGIYTIPLSGTANYVGAVGNGGEQPERPYKGEVKLKTPPGFPDIELTEEWVWKGTGTEGSKRGDVEWNLPSIMPRGTPFRVEGFHEEPNFRCWGYVRVQVDGGVFDSPLTPIALGGTVITGAGLGFAAVKKGRVA